MYLCPPWCTRSHDVEDTLHESDPTMLPVVLSTRRTVPFTEGLEHVDLMIRRGLYDGDVVDWIALEALDRTKPPLVLTIESARALCAAIREQLGLTE